jgi:hypothetical protein
MPALPPEWPGCPKAPGERRPLPDPAAVRLCLVPDSAPPYDDEVPAGTPAAATTWHPATGRPGTSEPGTDGPGTGRPVTGRPDTGRPVTGRPGNGRSVAGDRPTPGWQGRFAQALAETLAGSRPSRQIQPWTTQQAREHIQRLGPRMASVQRPRVRRVVTYRPASDVMEMAVVVGFGPRVRALAVRLERSAVDSTASVGEPAGRWVCTAVEAA